MMRKSLFSGIIFCLLYLHSNAQIYTPSISGSSNDANKAIIGTYTSPASYNAQLLINTKINNSTSTLNNLELNYSYQTPQVPPGTPYPIPSLSVIKANRWDAYAFPAAWSTVFDLKADGRLFLGTNGGTGTLNVGGAIHIPGTREVQLSHGLLGWKSTVHTGDFGNFKIRYLGDGTNPTANVMTFKPTGAVNIHGNLNPDANLAIGNNFTADSKVHIKTWAPTSGGEPIKDVYGLVVENTGWRTHDFAFEVRTAHGPVFSIGNAGHVLIGIQGDGSDRDINKEMANSDLYNLYVAKGIRTERIRVDVAADNGWADYVFENNYKLMPLKDVEKFIQKHGHLPGVPSASQVAEEGIDLAEMNKILLAKIEELTLHVIELEKKINN